MGEIVLVAVELAAPAARQQAFFLDEIDEHEAVEHERGVPFAVGLGGDALDEGEEFVVFFLEAVIEAFGDALGVERGAHAGGDDGGTKLVFFRDAEGQRLQFLREQFAGLVAVQAIEARGRRFARLAPHPLPRLLRASGVGIDDEVFVGVARQFALDSTHGGAARQVAARVRAAEVDLEVALLHERLQEIRIAIDGYRKRRAAQVIPAQFFNKELSEIESAEVLLDALSVGVHRQSFFLLSVSRNLKMDLFLTHPGYPGHML